MQWCKGVTPGKKINRKWLQVHFRAFCGYKGSKGLDSCYSAAYVSRTRDQERFTISKWQLIGMS